MTALDQRERDELIQIVILAERSTQSAEPHQVWHMLAFAINTLTDPDAPADALACATASVSSLCRRIRRDRLTPPEEEPHEAGHA